MRYAGKQNQLTTAIGAFFSDNNLKPMPQHSLYSLRHTFKDRLRAAKCPSEMFDANNDLDQKLLAVYAPLGVVPGRTYDPTKVAGIDGAVFREVAEGIAQRALVKASDLKFVAANMLNLFQPKGKMTLEFLLFQSILGPIGQPAEEAVYPAITTSDGGPMNASYDYVIRMKKIDLPPAKAYLSI